MLLLVLGSGVFWVLYRYSQISPSLQQATIERKPFTDDKGETITFTERDVDLCNTYLAGNGMVTRVIAGQSGDVGTMHVSYGKWSANVPMSVGRAVYSPPLQWALLH